MWFSLSVKDVNSPLNLMDDNNTSRIPAGLGNMDLDSMPLFSALARKMSWLTARQQVLAENVANVDTPGFKASDLRPLDFSAELKSAAAGNTGGPQLAPVVTSPLDIAASVPPDVFATIPDPASDDREINGNTVSLEDQMMEVSETASDYQLMSNLYKKQVGMMTDALDKGS